MFCAFACLSPCYGTPQHGHQLKSLSGNLRLRLKASSSKLSGAQLLKEVGLCPPDEADDSVLHVLSVLGAGEVLGVIVG